MFKGNITLNDKEIPRTLLGTSPFIAAAQFGHRSRLYQLDLYNKPENILKIIKKSYELGITGIQLVPFEPVVKALKWAVEEGCNLNIVGTVRPDRENEDIELLADLGASSMLLHGAITDKLDYTFLARNLEKIKEKGSIPGLATHRPFNTTKNLIKSPILDLFDIYMVPVNKTGYLMDTDVFMEKERAELRELINKINKTIIAKKTMAAGIMTPNDAFDYLKTLDYVDLMTVGIASEAEAEETFDLLANK
ncbi:MAG: hypothetical protein HZC47_03485 [Methanobacterium sp.]|uniref:hypothetical protein n=1 Tax=Methanobacterium sp. TaxID=2164 RepID=UPI003D65EB83|nr:hypothetical protein [Methanobacterium sp.]